MWHANQILREIVWYYYPVSMIYDEVSKIQYRVYNYVQEGICPNVLFNLIGEWKNKFNRWIIGLIYRWNYINLIDGDLTVADVTEYAFSSIRPYFATIIAFQLALILKVKYN